MTTALDDGRTLTDSDIEALKLALVQPVALAIKEQMVKELQLDVGRAVFVWAKRAILGLLVLAALWGATHFPDYIPQQIQQKK